jgi:D-sedoheptulose 7-phosphate isomerase
MLRRRRFSPQSRQTKGNREDTVQHADHFRTYIQTHLLASAEVKRRTVETCADSILAVAKLMVGAFQAGGKILLCGNGGSAADCQHMAAEFVSRLSRDVERPGLPALALTTDTSFLTAYANDVDFEGVFARQVEALGKRGDVLFAISTSGDSKNVLRAAKQARRMGLLVVALTGGQGRLPDLADIAIRVPSDNTQHIQEVHLAIEHILCHIAEQVLFGGKSSPEC